VTAHGTFYWNELATSDAEAARAFYTALVGWKTQDMPMGDGRTYTMWLVGGQPSGGMFPAKDGSAFGERPCWLAYIMVDDVDATAAKVEGLGGTVLEPPGDIPDVGRIAVIADPQGAPVALITPANGRS
jgi:predicted enzyme related to lactoylglutathione lyase